MKRIILAAALAVAATSSIAADVGVSVTVSQPGLYGRIDIGGFPRPPLLYAEPIIVHRAPGMAPPPLYLHVPPGHAKDWRKHCGKYNACGQPVYFVEERWYNDVYVPQYRERRGNGKPRDGDRGYDRGNGKPREGDRGYDGGRPSRHDGDEGRGRGGNKDNDRGKGRGHD